MRVVTGACRPLQEPGWWAGPSARGGRALKEVPGEGGDGRGGDSCDLGASQRDGGADGGVWKDVQMGLLAFQRETRNLSTLLSCVVKNIHTTTGCACLPFDSISG